jgi:hypothetical protein
MKIASKNVNHVVSVLLAGFYFAAKADGMAVGNIDCTCYGDGNVTGFTVQGSTLKAVTRLLNTACSELRAYVRALGEFEESFYSEFAWVLCSVGVHAEDMNVAVCAADKRAIRELYANTVTGNIVQDGRGSVHVNIFFHANS